MTETEQRRAAAEGVLDRILKREWHQLDLLLNQTGDAQFWADVLRYELDISSLSTGILERDKVLKELVELFGVRSMSAFHYAGVRGALRVIRKGLQFRMNVDFGLGDGVTVLHLATFAGKLETVVQLVDDFRANVNAEDRQRRRPLHYACAVGHKEIAEFLMHRGADVGARDTEGATAAYWAQQHSRNEIVSCLMEFYGDGDILLLEEEADSHQRPAPVYASLCRNDATTTSGVNGARVNGDGKGDAGRGKVLRVNGGDTGVYPSESTDQSVPVEIQRKSKILLKPIRRQGLKLDYEEVDLPEEEKLSSSELAGQEFSKQKRGISDKNNEKFEVSNVIEHAYASVGQKYQDKSLTVGINSQSDIKTNRCVEGTSYQNKKTDVKPSGYRTVASSSPSGFNKRPHQYEEINLPEGEPIEGNLPVKSIAYEEIDFVEGESSLPVFGRDCNAFKKPSTLQVPETKSGTGLKVSGSDGQGGYRDETNYYEELPDELSSEGNKVEEMSSVPGHCKRVCRSPYEEISLPEDNNSQVELGENVQTGTQTTGFLKAKTKLKERCVASTPSGFNKRPHQYEEINLPEDEPIEGNLPVKSIANNKTQDVSCLLTNSGFHRRPHFYEEIELPLGSDAETQTEDRSNDESLASRVRCLLRAELGTLLPLRYNRVTAAAGSAPSSRPTSTFIKDFFETGTRGDDDADSIGRYLFDDVVTVGQLRRIIREEIRLFRGCVQSIEVSKEFSDECFKHFNILDKSRNSTAVSHRLQEEDEEGEKEDEEDKVGDKDEEEKVCIELTKPKLPIDDVDISHNHETLDVSKNNNDDNKENVSSQSKPQDRSLASILCSPGHFRRVLFNRKTDSSKHANGRQTEPTESPSMKTDALINSDSTTKTERSSKQLEDGCISAGHSQFYVRLDDDDTLPSTDS